jgi:hypothetical protein
MAVTLAAALTGAEHAFPSPAHAGPPPIQHRREITQARYAATSPGYSLDPRPLPVRLIGAPRVQKPGAHVAWESCDSIRTIAQVYPSMNAAFTFGDTDHDGRNEFIAAVDSNYYHLRIVEDQGNNHYVDEYVGPYIDPYAAGDFDLDGRADILGQYSYYLFVYESPDSTTHPSLLVWQSPPMTNIEGFTTVADTDCDGRPEIIHSINTFGTARLIIYENTGDNTFDQVFYQVESPQDDGPKVIADLDGDGRPEIADCGTYGYLHIFESPADNVWQQVFADSTGLYDAYGVAGGVDTDGNGRPELFVSGMVTGHPELCTYVYEAVGDNTYERVADLTYRQPLAGGVWSSVADLDGSGHDAFILNAADGLLVYRGVAPGQWAFACTIADPTTDGLYNYFQPFDANQNGRAELFWTTMGNARPEGGNTLVLEYPESSPTDIPGRSLPGKAALTLTPNPWRPGTNLSLTPPLDATVSSISIYDVAGRLVDRTVVGATTGNVQWTPRLQSSGVYLIRLENANRRPLAQGRLTAIR